MVYRPRRLQVDLVGGGSGRRSGWGDPWAWDGTTWTQKVCPPFLRLPLACPSPQFAHGMAYDNLSRIVVYGGMFATGPSIDSTALLWGGEAGQTFTWGGSGWMLAFATTWPGNRI